MYKKFVLLSAIAATAVLSGCNDNSLKIQGESSTIKASAEQASSVTKVSLDTNAGVFEWQGGDTLAVCTSKSGRGVFTPFSIVGGGRASEAEFLGEIADSAIKDCAVFPYIYGNQPYFKDGDLYVKYPSLSQYWEKSSRAPMYASVAEYDKSGVMAFRHLGGVVNVKIAPVQAWTAEIVLLAGTRVSGSFKVNRSSEGVPYVATEALGSDISENQMSVTFARLVTEQEQMYVQFPLPVGDYSHLRFQTRNITGTMLQSFRSTSEVSVSRGEVINLVVEDDPMPGFRGSESIGVSHSGIQNGTFKVPVKNNNKLNWTLSLVEFGGCVSAASVADGVLTYSVGPNESETESRDGFVTLKLSDPLGKEVPVTATFKFQQRSKNAKYYTKVTSEQESWEGKYLIVYESESEVYAMCSDSEYNDNKCPGVTLPLEPEGICQTAQSQKGEIIIKKHAPDATGGVNNTPIEGAYTLFLDSQTGFGRFAGDVFGFNNNSAYGRFVTTITYDDVKKCPVITCKTKAKGLSYMKYDSSLFTFGFGLPSEISDSGRYLDLQLYKLQD